MMVKMLLRAYLIVAASLSVVSCMQIGTDIFNVLTKIKDTAVQFGNYVEDKYKDMKPVLASKALQAQSFIRDGAVQFAKFSKEEYKELKKVAEVKGSQAQSFIKNESVQLEKFAEKEYKEFKTVVQAKALQAKSFIRDESVQLEKFAEKEIKELETVAKAKALQAESFIKKEAGQFEKFVEEEYKILKADFQITEHTSCSCVNYTCGCCIQVEDVSIALNETGCVKVSYLRDEYGFSFVFTLNGKSIIGEKISVKNPPPICNGILYVHQLASVCIRFYNLDYKYKQFSGCADIELWFDFVIVKKYDFGCIHIPHKSEKYLEGNKP